MEHSETAYAGHGQASGGHAEGGGHAEEGQSHPISVYLKIWALLFVLSAGSYLVDFFGVQSYLRWTLITVFMLLKAGLIISVFMHMQWERLALLYAIIIPPLLLMVLLALMALEADYTSVTRLFFFGVGS